MPESRADSSRSDWIERVADLLREEFYETLQDAAGAGESYDYEAFAARLVAQMPEREMRLWLAEAGYGIWVVRAASKEAARELAMDGTAEHTGGRDYGLKDAEVEVRELTTDGDPDILDHMYA